MATVKLAYLSSFCSAGWVIAHAHNANVIISAARARDTTPVHNTVTVCDMRWELCVISILLWQFPGGEFVNLHFSCGKLSTCDKLGFPPNNVYRYARVESV